jgi:membrane protein YqaA with SNARE-associated domain
MKTWFKKIRIWSLQWANTKWGPWALFLCAFLDASILGFPTPMLFLALALIDITKAYKYAIIGTFGTLLGALAGYLIGHFAWLNNDGGFTGVAQFFFNNIPGFSETGYDKIHLLYARWDFWILFMAAALPLPYKIFSITSGVFDINLLIFCIATLISQALKFYLLAILTIKLGPEVKKLFRYNWKPIAIITTAGIALVIILFKIF